MEASAGVSAGIFGTGTGRICRDWLDGMTGEMAGDGVVIWGRGDDVSGGVSDGGRSWVEG